MLDFSISNQSSFTPSRQLDVIVVGAGAAGLYTALCLPSHLRVGLITKDTLSLSASDWAQGGIAAVIAPEDSFELHIQDTLQAGAGLCDYEAVQFLVENAPRCIESLVQMGVGFDRHHGSLALTLEAAHSRRRVLHAADTTGRAVVSTLTTQVLERKNIQVFSQALALHLCLHSETRQCQGLRLLYQGQILSLAAPAIFLATGGGGQVFAQTTNPSSSTGDGIALAWRAGAILRDLEFIQFHPTALTKPGAPRFLISEAVRGEGAHLVDRHGHRFAFDYHPAGELAPRDVVSRAIFNHLQQTEPGNPTAHVWLDLRPIPAETIHRRFPNIIQVCQCWDIDVFETPIPVAPAAHYWMGGIVTDLMNRTSIPGLYALGETASTGVHGANRLASNSLLECLVFGAQLTHLEGQGSREWQEESVGQELGQVPLSLTIAITPTELEQIQSLQQELRRLVWQSAGICREATGLVAAIAQVQSWKQEFLQLALSQTLLNLPSHPIQLDATAVESAIRLWGETYNLLDVAYLLLKSAYFRTESRGGHYRSDYPNTDSTWQAHTLIQGEDWSKSVPIGSPKIGG